MFSAAALFVAALVLGVAAPRGIDAFTDLFGPDYVQLAVNLGVAPTRIDTLIAREKAHELGTKAEGRVDASTTDVLAEMATLVASGQIEIPIAATYPPGQSPRCLCRARGAAHPRRDCPGALLYNGRISL